MGQKRGDWEVLSSRIVHKNPYYQVREDEVIRPNGEPGRYYVAETGGAVFIVALDAEQNLYLVDLFRYTVNKASLEIPAGATDGEDPLTAAKRELQEETGLLAATWQQLGTIYPTNGIFNEENHVFIATDLTETNQNAQAEEGIHGVVKIHYTEALLLIKDGRITDAQTIAGLMLAALELGWSVPPN